MALTLTPSSIPTGKGPGTTRRDSQGIDLLDEMNDHSVVSTKTGAHSLKKCTPDHEGSRSRSRNHGVANRGTYCQMPAFRWCCSISCRRVPRRMRQKLFATNSCSAALDGLKKSKPAAFYSPDAARLITLGNFDDDLALIAGCDWIIEVVAENLEIKRSLLQRVLRSIASRAPSRRRIRRVCRLPISLLDSTMTCNGTGSARTSSIRPGTCVCWRSFRPRLDGSGRHCR